MSSTAGPRCGSVARRGSTCDTGLPMSPSIRRYPVWLVPGSGEERRDAVAAARPHCYDPAQDHVAGTQASE